MDERRFKDIVRGGIPDPDENARKRAVYFKKTVTRRTNVSGCSK